MSETSKIKIGKVSSSEINTHEQTMHMAEDLVKSSKAKQKDRFKKAPINNMPSSLDRIKYIMYCITFLKNKKERIFMQAMIELLKAHSHEDAYRELAIGIFKNKNANSIKKVKEIEGKILDNVCNEIEKLRLTGTPILGGLE